MDLGPALLETRVEDDPDYHNLTRAYPNFTSESMQGTFGLFFLELRGVKPGATTLG